MSRLNKSSRTKSSGQSLVELVLCLPLLTFLLVGGFYMGRIIMTAQTASDQIHKANFQKRALADKDAGNASTDFAPASDFDEFKVVYSTGPSATPYDPAILVGTKTVSAPLIGTVKFTVASPINRPLVDNNPGGSLDKGFATPVNQGITCPGNRPYISHLYRTLLSRDPESRGVVTSHASEMAAHSARWKVKDMVHSAEFQGSGLTNRQIVSRLYKAVLLRAPDPMYIDKADRLDAGTSSLDNIVDEIFDSAENGGNVSAGKAPPCS